ncbi:MAG TPA: hypothetical protein VGC37_12020 [Friedmanniella sp.]
MDVQDELTVPWLVYALTRIQQLVDIPREKMTDDQLSVYTFASNALAGGDPVIAFVDRGPGRRLCRLCLAEWSSSGVADHVYGCPLGGSGTATSDAARLPHTHRGPEETR